MITVYEMKTCPDCAEINHLLQDKERFHRVDIGEHVSNMKAFIQLRDSHPAFDDAKKEGYIGIPCFVTKDDDVFFDLADIRHA